MEHTIFAMPEMILCTKATQETKTKAGIYLPESTKNLANEAIVVMAGPTKLELEVKPGDKISFSEYGFTNTTVEGKPYIAVKYADVIAVSRVE